MKPGLHQSSVLSDLSPLLFAIVMVRGGESSILGAIGDLILMATTREAKRRQLVVWRVSLVAKGLKVDSGKIKLTVSVGDRDV